MKFKKFLMSLIVIILSLFITTVKADTAPESFQVRRSDLHWLNGKDVMSSDSGINFTYKKTTDGKIVYCTDSSKNMTDSIETYTRSSELEAKYAYVLANGYPNKSITGNDDRDYYITGLAIWYLINPNDSVFTNFGKNADGSLNGMYKGHSSQVVKEVAKLVNGAKNYSYTNPSIKINNFNSNFSLSADKKYYVSNLISVTTTGGVSTYNISLKNAPQGTFITDKNGNIKISLDSKESFLIKIPVSSIKDLTTSFSITVSGTGYIYTAYKYNPTYSSHQGLMAGYSKPVNVNASANLKLEIKTKAEIIKIDADTNKPLEGATLLLTGPDGYTKTIVSKNTATVLEGLKFGKYTVTETKAPNGYKTSEEKKTFELTPTNTSIKVTFENYKEGEVLISKVDATTSEELEGAILVLTGPNNFEKTWRSGTTPKTFKNLQPGKYTLKEIYAPNGYILNEDTITFTVDKNGNVAEKVVMKNYPEGKTKVSKIDATTGEELEGAIFVLTNEKGKEIDRWTSTTEPHIIKNLQPGKYTLVEEEAPKGYIKSDEKITFTVDKYGKVKEKFVVKNYKKGTTAISKVDATTGKEIEGATLELTGPNNFKETWTSTTEPHIVKDLEPGKYTLKETIAPNGYILSEEVIEFTVDKNGKVVEKIEMKNYPLGTVLISKQDITSKEELYGAYLEVYKEDGTLVEAWTSGKEPHPIQLEEGKYYLIETQAPDGYILSEEKIEFEIDENGKLKDGEIVIMYNERIPDSEVPKTSSFKSITTSIIGIITIVLGAIIIKVNYKKNEEI